MIIMQLACFLLYISIAGIQFQLLGYICQLLTQIGLDISFWRCSMAPVELTFQPECMELGSGPVCKRKVGSYVYPWLPFYRNSIHYPYQFGLSY